jgi:hypothetical protein
MLEQDNYFDARELGLDDLNPYINVNISEAYSEDGEPKAGRVLAIVEVQESLRFHAELDAKYADPDFVIFTEQGELTEEGYKALERALEARYGAEDVELRGEDTEDAYIRFELALEVPADTDPEDLGSLIWEQTKLIQFHNEADPGTFGSPYLFGTVIAEYRL